MTRVHINNIPAPTYTLEFADQGSWNARVYAVNAAGLAGVPSNVVAFSVLFNNPVGPPPTPLSPAGGVTVNLPVTLSWADVPNPQPSGYEVQISSNATFSTIEADLPQLNGPTFTVLSLTAGPKFWRVRSGQGDSGPFTLAVTAWSTLATFTVNPAPPSVTAVTLTRAAPFSGDQEIATVQLSSAAPAGAVVSLTSSNPTAAPVPATVSIPAGVALATFTFTLGQVTTATPVTLTASLGPSSTPVTFTVSPPSLNSLSVNPSRISGGGTPGGIIMLNGAAPPGGAVVSLTSSSSAVGVPATVTVAPGSPSASFTVTTNPVSADTPATVTASWNGGTVLAQLTVTPPVPPASISLSPNSTTGTNGSSGVITLASPAPPEGAAISLSSSNPAVATVPTGVIVPGGAVATGFIVTTSPAAVPTTVTISATAAGVTRSATLTVNPFPTAPLPAPTLLTPANGARIPVGQLLSFDWGDVAGAASYTIQISTTSTFSSTLVDQVVPASLFATSSLPAQSLFWRVRANAAGGSAGTWSAVGSFRVK
ncbi:MAG: hypothetical protein E6G27_00060 [Actinobacteria bacterium]|nr:MAG: hypothetical protein E6G27_00060 [Actinomycetota bacterium]